MSKVEPENYLCRCCHSEGTFASLYSSNCWLDTEEIVYYNLLRECFDIELSPVPASLQQKLSAICDVCAQRLQEAVQFKRQVDKCERRFRDVYSSYIGEHPALEVKVKQEVVDDEKEDVLSTPVLAFNGLTSNIIPIPIPVPNPQPVVKPNTYIRDDFDEDDDAFNDPDDDIDYKPSEEEKVVKDGVKSEAEESETEKSERKSKRIAQQLPESSPMTVFVEPSTCPRVRNTAATKKKRTRVRVKKNPNSSDDEELDNIDGVSFIRVKPTIKRINVDFKLTDEIYECLRCPEKFKSISLIRKHVQVIHFDEAIKYKCPVCFQGFLKIPALVKHKLQVHEQDQRYRCNACDKSFLDKNSLKTHIAGFHMIGQIFKCTECTFETRNKTSYLNHKSKKHTTIKKYKCKFCGKAFKRNYALTLHERIHTGDKRKKCTECEEAFIDRTSLKYHMTKRHPDVNF